MMRYTQLIILERSMEERYNHVEQLEVEVPSSSDGPPYIVLRHLEILVKDKPCVKREAKLPFDLAHEDACDLGFHITVGRPYLLIFSTSAIDVGSHTSFSSLAQIHTFPKECDLPYIRIQRRWVIRWLIDLCDVTQKGAVDPIHQVEVIAAISDLLVAPNLVAD